MQDGFKKFKKRQQMITLVNTLVFGVAAVLLSLGVLFLVDKLNKTSLHVLFYVFVPAVVCGIAVVATYFIFRKKDRKLAGALDEEFSLNDRVQTMVEFENVQTDMVRLQREDTHLRLNGLSASKMKWKGWISCLVAIVLATAMFVTGLVIPKKVSANGNPPPAPPEYVFEITLAQKTALGTLIKDVKGSRAEDEVKTTITTELETLQLMLDEIETAEELYGELIRIISVIDDFVEDHNTYKRIYDPIRVSELETVQQFAIGLGMNSLPTTITTLKTAFSNDEKDGAVAQTTISGFVTELKARYAEVDENAEDALMVAIAALIADMETVAAIDPTAYTYDWIIDQAEQAMNDNVTALAAALTQQTENRTVTNDAIKRLISIFNIPAELIPAWGGRSLTGLDNAPTPDEPPTSGDGIIIDGILYPSNEKVYDYYTKVICEYGKVFEGDAYNYKAAINTLISEGIANGTITPEVEEMLRAYLDALSGAEQPSGGEN